MPRAEWPVEMEMDQDTAGVPQQLLVTTSRSLLLVEPHSGRIERMHSGAGLYYGIDIGADRILVAARNRMVSSTDPIQAERGEILVFDRQMQLIGSIGAAFAFRDLHQIRTFAGRLYATCSFDNMIAVKQEGVWMQWHPLGKPSAEPWDVNHFNTVEFIDGQLSVLAHNHGASEILLFDPETHELSRRIALGMQAHNVWKHGTEWRVCSSAEGCLLGSEGFRVETGGFPRGIWIGPNHSIVGVSELAERQARDFTHGKLLVYDASWRRCDEILLDGEGLVLDIAPLSYRAEIAA